MISELKITSKEISSNQIAGVEKNSGKRSNNYFHPNSQKKE
jgi:hypothetical protein